MVFEFQKLQEEQDQRSRTDRDIRGEVDDKVEQLTKDNAKEIHRTKEEMLVCSFSFLTHQCLKWININKINYFNQVHFVQLTHCYMNFAFKTHSKKQKEALHKLNEAVELLEKQFEESRKQQEKVMSAEIKSR